MTTTDTPTPAELIDDANHVLSDHSSNLREQRMARHILATAHADGDLPADAEWFAGLPGATRSGIEISFRIGEVYGTAWAIVRLKVCLYSEQGQAHWECRNPTRGQVRLACLSMGHTLKEGE